MPHDDLTTRVLSIIAEAQQLAPHAVTLDTTFDELQVDSLGAVALLAEMEMAFDIEVPNEQVLKIRTVREVVSAVRALAGGAPVAGASIGGVTAALATAFPLPAPEASAAARPAMH